MSFVARLLLAVVIFFFIEFYFYKRVKNSVVTVFPNFSRKKLRVIFTTFFTVTNIYPALLIGYWVYIMITGGTRHSPIENSLFDYLVMYPFWVMVLMIAQVIIYFIPVDILRLVLYPFYKKYKEKVKYYVSVFATGLTLLALVYVPFRIIYDYNTVNVSTTEINVENLPDEMDGFTLTFISDTQADRFTDRDRLMNFIDKVNQTNPDLVLMGGDVITSTPDYIEEGADALGKINSKYGVYTTVGDHDNWAYRNDYQRSLHEINDALQKNNVHMMNNENKIFNFGDFRMKITFATYTYVTKISDDEIDSLAQNNSTNDFSIFLTHQPNEFLIDRASENHYDLFLAGHTHGGQITLYFPFVNLTPTLMETNYIRGFYSLNGMDIIITPGLGMSIASVRYNSTPGVSEIIFRRK